MPLHADDERCRGQLDRLDDAVGGARRDLETVADPGERLVVRAAHQGAIAHGPWRRRVPGSVRDLHVGETAGLGAVPGVPHHVGQVLHERPPELDVQHLHAAADGEHGGARRQGGAEQRELAGVAPDIDAGGVGVRLLAVTGGVDVAAADEDERVERVHHGRAPHRRAPLCRRAG